MQFFKQVSTSFFLLCTLVTALLLAGCGADEPSKDHVRMALETELLKKGAFEVADLTPEWVQTGNELEGKSGVTLRLKEEYFVRADLDDALAAAGLDSAENALLRHAVSQAGSQAEPLRSSLLEKAPDSLDGQRFIKVSEAAGTEFTGTAILKAKKISSGWTLEVVEFVFPSSAKGTPRAKLPEEALVVGSPETVTFMSERIEAIRRYAASVDAAIADAANAQLQAREERRARLTEALKTGALFMGTMENARDKSITETGLVVEETQAASGVLRGYVFNSSDPRQKYPFTGSLRDSELPVLLNVGGGYPLPVIELALQGTRLLGNGVNPDNGRLNAAIAWAPAGKEDLEAKTAAALAAEQQRQAALDAYQAALTAAFAPGNAFQGVWARRTERGELGLVIEEVADNGLSASGFLYDPADRSKRKPFTATINREHEAKEVFVLRATRTQGMKDSRDVTPMQRNWLLEAHNYTTAFAFQDGSLVTGETVLNPLSNFAELLARDAEAEKAYQATLTAAFAPGSAFQGVWAGRDARGELGLFIEAAAENGLSANGFLYDPADRSKRKPFTATINRDHDAKDILVIRATRGQGVEDSRNLTPVQRNWLLASHDYTNAFAFRDGSLVIENTVLNPLPGFSELLAQDAEAEKAYREALKALIQPGTTYRGTWKLNEQAGEIGLTMLTRSADGTVFTAELFDPAEPAVVWTYTGSVTEKDMMLVLLPTTQRQLDGAFMHTGSTQRMLNGHRANYDDITFMPSGDDNTDMAGMMDTMALVLYRSDVAPKTQEAAPASSVPPVPAEASTPEATPAPAESAYPPLVSNDGKAKIAAHAVGSADGTAILALQVLAPGKTVEAIRIDNIGGASIRWRSDGAEGAAPMTVSLNGERLSSGTETMSLAAGDTELLLSLSLKDTNAFAQSGTEFRVTVFFSGGERVMGMLAVP